MKLRVAGVPEHFNLPWHVANEKGFFSASGIELEWIDVPGGTGAMIQMLDNEHADMALLLTEGAVKHPNSGKTFEIISQYVASPLTWGIHVAGGSNLKNVNELKNLRFAISRIGSGSHLMPKVWAKVNGFELSESQFVVINHLQGAIEALNKAEAEVFFWEKFTTMPFVLQGFFKRLGEFPTPWPCFVAAVPSSFSKLQKDAAIKALEIALFSASLLKKAPNDTVKLIAERHHLSHSDATEWFNHVKWAENAYFDTHVVNMVTKYL